MAVLEELERLSDDRFLAIYQALAQNGFGPLDSEVAQALRFRPQAIRKLPFEKRARQARKIVQNKRNTELCYELFGSYLVQTKKELVTGFLDATGVEHNDGMIDDLDKNEPDPTKIPAALEELDSKFAPEDVTLYMALCCEQWPQAETIANSWKERAALTS